MRLESDPLPTSNFTSKSQAEQEGYGFKTATLLAQMRRAHKLAAQELPRYRRMPENIKRETESVKREAEKIKTVTKQVQENNETLESIINHPLDGIVEKIKQFISRIWHYVKKGLFWIKNCVGQAWNIFKYVLYVAIICGVVFVLSKIGIF